MVAELAKFNLNCIPQFLIITLGLNLKDEALSLNFLLLGEFFDEAGAERNVESKHSALFFSKKYVVFSLE